MFNAIGTQIRSIHCHCSEERKENTVMGVAQHALLVTQKWRDESLFRITPKMLTSQVPFANSLYQSSYEVRHLGCNTRLKWHIHQDKTM